MLQTDRQSIMLILSIVLISLSIFLASSDARQKPTLCEQVSLNVTAISELETRVTVLENVHNWPTPTQEIATFPVPTEWPQETYQVRVTVWRLNIRVCPAVTCAIRAQADSGDILTVWSLDALPAGDYTWYELVDGGWIASDFVEVLS